MARVLLTFFSLYFLLPTAFGSELEHLGGAPVGTTLVELKSNIAVTPLQLTGTLSPATLLFNGKALELGPGGQAPQDSGAWINGRPIKTTGSSGSFFTQLSGKDAVISSLEIVLKSEGKPARHVVVPVNRIFLDAPIRVRRVASSGELASGNFKFELTGEIPSGDVLRLNDGRTLESGQRTLALALASGPTVISGKLEQKDGSVRVINAPFELNVIPYEAEKPILSIKSVDADDAIEIRGLTNPGAILTVEKTPAKVQSDGAFEVTLNPPAGDTTVHFDVAMKDGTSSEFTKTVSCPGCGKTTRKLSLARARTGSFNTFETAGGASYSFFVTWAPETSVNRWLGLQAEIGASFLNKSGGGLFPASLYVLHATLDFFHPVRLELGGGAQTWIGYGTYPLADGTLCWTLKKPILFLFDRIIAGYSAYFVPGDFIQQIRAGLGVALFK